MGQERVVHGDGGLPLCYKVLMGETSCKRGRDCRGGRDLASQTSKDTNSVDRSEEPGG
jgi:hypothetical protein